MNSLNKLTHPKEDDATTDKPSQSTAPLESSAFRYQFLFNLLTIGLIVAAIAFPFAVKGTATSVTGITPLPSNSAEETSDSDSDSDSTTRQTGANSNLVSGEISSDLDSPVVVSNLTAGEVEASSDLTAGEPGSGSDMTVGGEASADSESTTGEADADSELTIGEIDIDSEVDTDSDSTAGEEASDSDSKSGLTYPRIPVDSTDIVSIGHNPKSKNLFIEFKGGRVYRYAGVPTKVYDNLMKADSHGTFFSDEIKNAGYEVKQMK